MTVETDEILLRVDPLRADRSEIRTGHHPPGETTFTAAHPHAGMIHMLCHLRGAMTPTQLIAGIRIARILQEE